jgi:hypothetical protein
MIVHFLNDQKRGRMILLKKNFIIIYLDLKVFTRKAEADDGLAQ